MSPGDEVSDQGGNLVRMIRGGRSFSGREQNCVFLNTRGSANNSRFANVSAVTGLDFPDDARAVARVDWDFDGDLDFWISNRNAPAVRFLRNDHATDHHTLSLRLRGRECNRDAIGARVELTLQNEKRPILRTVSAGDGYLAQSTKWAHFGLGKNATIDRLRVRWPGGNWETFANVEADKQYELTQGTGVATPWQSQAHAAELPPRAMKLPKLEAASSVYSAMRMPLPRLEYEAADGQLTAFDVQKPTLVILWASWCQPCLQELRAIAEQADTLRGQDLRVLALSVDRLGGTAEAKDQGDIEKTLGRLGFGFDRGYAVESTVQKLQLVNDHLFGLQRALPVPSSFLIDSQNRLVALYRGQVTTDRVLEDLQRIDFDHEQRRDASIPFKGRWAGKARTLRLSPFVIELARAGYLEAASEYVQRIQNRFDRSTILDLVVRLGVGYFRENRMDYAKLHFEMATKIDPNTVLPQLRLGSHLEDRQRYRDAADLYRSSNHVLCRVRLAWLQAACPESSLREPEAGKRFAEALLKQSPDFVDARDVLAASHAALGNFEEAVALAESAEQLARKQGRSRLAEEIRSRVNLYRQKQIYLLAKT